MVKMGPPDSVFDGLNLSMSGDRITALERLTKAVADGEVRMLASGKLAACENPPSSQQLETLWMGLACTSAAVRALAEMMMEQERHEHRGK